MQTLFTCLKKISVTAVLATSLAAGIPAISQATPMLKYTIGSGSGTGGAFTPPVPGMVTITGSTTNGVIYSFTGSSKPAVGSAEKPMLDLFSMNLKNTGPATTADVWLTDTGFSGHTTPLGLLSSYGGTLGSGGTAQFWSYADSGDAAWSTSTLLQNSGLIKTGGSFGGDLYSSNTLTSPFSLTLHAHFKLGVGTSVTSADQSISVPEPGVLGMVGLGVLMVGVMGLRFRQARYRGDHSKV